MNSRREGFFFVFDGIDGCGKGTQIELLKAKLERVTDRKVVVYKQPGCTDLGLALRDLIFPVPGDERNVGSKNVCTTATELMFLTSHLQGLEETLKSAVNAGKIVIADRYYYSAFAYGLDRGIPQPILDLYGPCIDFAADKFFLMCGDPATLLERANRRKTESHQGTKAWNQVDNMTRIQGRFINMFGSDLNTQIVPVTQGEPNTDSFYQHDAEAVHNFFVWPYVKQVLGR